MKHCGNRSNLSPSPVENLWRMWKTHWKTEKITNMWIKMLKTVDKPVDNVENYV